MRAHSFTSILLVLAIAMPAFAQTPSAPPASESVAPADSLGPRPELLKYPPLNFKPANPADFRVTLSNGLVVYIAEDHQIPWFQASLLMRTATGVEPREKLGVESLTSMLMREGGTTSMTGEQINERIDFLAGSVSATGLSIHMRSLDEGLKIWMDILTNPAFPEDKLRREKDVYIPALRNRNKNVSTVTEHAFERLIYGDDSPIAAQMTDATVSTITRDDLIAWHRKYWGASNAILIVSGDFSRADMIRKLEATFGKWRKADKVVPSFPNVQQVARAGVYAIQPEVIPNQGIIQIGHIGILENDPDYPAVELMNDILGGGSFASRITKVVRTENGLAYSARSSYSGGTYYPGVFMAFCQTKTSTVVFATQLMLDLIDQMRTGGVTEAELAMAKNARLNGFPSEFEGVNATLWAFAMLEHKNRPMDFYNTYEARYNQVTVADIQRVARKWLHPDKLVILIGGNIDGSRAGADTTLPNQSGIDAMAAEFGGRTLDGVARKYGDGTVHILSLK